MGAKTRDEMLGIAVSEELYTSIVAEASRRGTTVSGTVRQLVQEALGLPVEGKVRRSRINEQIQKNAMAESMAEAMATAKEAALGTDAVE